MAEDNQQGSDNIEITPGSEEFGKMVFRLNNPVNAENVSVLNYNGAELEQIQDGVYAQPAFVSDDFNLFFVVTQLIGDDWIIAFSKATIENGNEITDLSDPLPTGEGLNLLGQTSSEDANNLLSYFGTLVDAKRGEWRLIE